LSSVTLSNLPSCGSEHLRSRADSRQNGKTVEVKMKLAKSSKGKRSYWGILIGVIIVVLLAAGAYAYYQPGTQPQAKTETVNVDIKTVTENGADHHVFDPGTITVHKGDHIVLTVTNMDQDHTHGIMIPELNLNTGPLTNGQSAKLEFDATTTGTFTMQCSVPGCADDHAQMIGQLIVTE
jgi:heme/copper-type cytochrome/quinol oxidase subunit 2